MYCLFKCSFFNHFSLNYLMAEKWRQSDTSWLTGEPCLWLERQVSIKVTGSEGCQQCETAALDPGTCRLNFCTMGGSGVMASLFMSLVMTTFKPVYFNCESQTASKDQHSKFSTHLLFWKLNHSLPVYELFKGSHRLCSSWLHKSKNFKFCALLPQA